tara:strand:- start:6503 stop:7228 length:726 start_codon:yes stop_codon:yes gene_type:complete
MISIILAAGKGSRLYPLTINKPKCLVKYKNKSILSHQINILNQVKIKKIYLVSGYKSSQIKIKKIFKKKNLEFRNSNMVYSLFKFNKLFNGKEDIVISYGDIIFKKKVIQKLINENESLSTVIDTGWLSYWKKRFKNPLDDAETMKMNKKFYITDIGKKTKSYNNIQGQYIGLIKIKKEITKDVLKVWNDKSKSIDKKKIKNMYFTDFLRILIKQNFKLKAVLIKRGWLEFDQPSDLQINL